MKIRALFSVGVLLLAISLVLSVMLMIPEVRDFRQCSEYSLRAFEGLLIYWGNYTLPAGLSNISLSVVSYDEVVLNVTYGVTGGEPEYAVVLSRFTYFIGNSTYFYVYVIPYEDTGLSVCLSALLITQRSYLIPPTLASWICGTIIMSYAALTHIERVFRKSLKSRKPAK